MKWRITYTETDPAPLGNIFNATEGRCLIGLPQIEQSPKMELRASNGAIIRLAQGGHFSVIDSPFGEAPQTFGEVYISRENPHKYVRTCWVGRSPSSASIDYFIRPLAGQQADQYFALVGDLVVFEFDRTGKPYDIVSVSEGQTATVSFTEAADGSHIYSASSPSPIPDVDYDYILANFIDPRNWR